MNIVYNCVLILIQVNYHDATKTSTTKVCQHERVLPVHHAHALQRGSILPYGPFHNRPPHHVVVRKFLHEFLLNSIPSPYPISPNTSPPLYPPTPGPAKRNRIP